MNISSWENRVDGVIKDDKKFMNVIEDLQDVTLNDAVMSMGIGPKEYLCVKEIAVPVKLNLSKSIRSVARSWSKAFAKQLEAKRQLNDGSTAHYASLMDAHIDCANGVLENDTRRLWAWQQVGVFTSGAEIKHEYSGQELIEHWSKDSISRGNYQIALWKYLLGSPKLETLIFRLEKHHWQQHFSAIKNALKITTTQIETYIESRFSVPFNQADQTPQPGKFDLRTSRELLLKVPPILRDSSLISALSKATSEQQKILLSMIIVLSEPSLANMDKEAQNSRLENICDPIDAALYGRSRQRRENDEVPSITPHEDIVGRLVYEQHISTGNQAQAEINKNEDTAIVEPNNEASTQSDSTLEQSSEALTTRFGGVFFLFNILLERTEIIDELLSRSALANRPHAWILSWLAHQLLPEPSFGLPLDPSYENVMMVFAGLESPTEFKELIIEKPDSAQLKIIHSAAEEIKTEFLDKLTAHGAEPTISYAELIRRKASIEREGPWTEILYSANDVDIDVRRAGLDADPGFIQWLGLVLRFVYA